MIHRSRFVFLGLASALAIMPSLSAYADDAVSCQTQVVSLLARSDSGNPTDFVGLTSDGIETLRKIRDSVRRRDALIRDKFYGLENLNFVSMLGRINGRNVFISGPPGGAKSAFVTHFIKGEPDGAFELQVHGMMTESALMGRETEEGFRDGSGTIATDKGIAPHKVAFLDEINLGNPIMLASILSLLNEEERFFRIGGTQQLVPTKLQTLFSTSNYTLAEFEDAMAAVGLKASAEAALRRISYKPVVWNWLPLRGQEILDKRRLERDLLRAFEDERPEIKNHHTFQNPEAVDWRSLWRLARAIFRPSAMLETASREFANHYRDLSIKAIKDSENENKTNPRENPLVYMPTMQSNEARRLAIMETIVSSAMVDFLLSPMSDDDKLGIFAADQKGRNKTAPQPVYLDISSLWRGLYEATAAPMGEAKLTLVQGQNTTFNIDFGWELDPSRDGANERQAKWIAQLRQEQERFAVAYSARIEEYQKTLKDLAPWMSVENQKDWPFHGRPFERYLIQSRPQN